MRRLDAILFDLDDTLYSEQEYVRSGMYAVASWVHAQLGHHTSQTARELLELLRKHGSGTTFDRWLRQEQLDVMQWVPQMVDVYRTHEPKIVLHEGVGGLLASLRRRYRLGIVTDGFLESQTRKVSALGIGDCFDVIVYTDALGGGREYWKPSVRPYEAALQQLGVSAVNAMYVGDNPAKDFRGARELGMSTVRVRYESGLRFCEESRDASDAPDCEIADLRQLEDVLSGHLDVTQRE